MFKTFEEDYKKLIENMDSKFFAGFCKNLLFDIENIFDKKKNANIEKWMKAFGKLPDFRQSELIINNGEIVFEDKKVDEGDLKNILKGFCPWRKGPYNIGGVHIETEWRSDMKWDRLVSHIKPLKNKTVLDIGCGSGYHLWRMHEEGASLALGIEPSMLSIIQFQTIKKFSKDAPVFILPFGIEDMPEKLESFDTVFSMGILYHRRSPIGHLKELNESLKQGGELVLETLVIEGDEGRVLVPEDRYASMRNVWFLPSVPELEKWMRRSGFTNIRCVDINKTTAEEQKSTEWMKFYSLVNFLDPKNPEKTIEGYPAPRRAIIIADKK